MFDHFIGDSEDSGSQEYKLVKALSSPQLVDQRVTESQMMKELTAIGCNCKPTDVPAIRAAFNSDGKSSVSVFDVFTALLRHLRYTSFLNFPNLARDELDRL